MEPGHNRVLGRLRNAAALTLVAALVAISRPDPVTVSVGIAIVAAGEGLRVWAAGHLCKTVELITAGPYRFTRNPLYLGRLGIFSGLCIVCPLPYRLHLVVLGAGTLVFFLYYLPRKERVEPARLREAHGERYERYRRGVPALWPRWPGYDDPGAQRWSAERFLRNREHWMVAGLVAVSLFQLYRAWLPAG